MKQLTTTKATYRQVSITVSADRFEGNTVYCCDNSLSGARATDTWFPTQGEAMANERREIDKKMGLSHDYIAELRR